MKIKSTQTINDYTSPIEVNEIEIEPKKIIILTGNGFSFKNHLVSLLKQDAISNHKSVLYYDYPEMLKTEKWGANDVVNPESVKDVVDEINLQSDDIIERAVRISGVILVNTQSKELIKQLVKKTADISCYMITDLSCRIEVMGKVVFERKYKIEKINIKV